jgi:cellulose synthase/poly-beta-1,6-N-acetylglucosamine synthase-like glycosyltransferase
VPLYVFDKPVSVKIFPPPFSFEDVHKLLLDAPRTFSFGVSSYNDGPGISETLESLYQGMVALGLQDSPILLSDSSSDGITLRSALEWKKKSGANLINLHSDERRSLKQALNVHLGHADTDFLVLTVGDVVIPRESLAQLVGALLSQKPDVAIGAPWPDPHYRGLAYRAGAWQLRSVQRLAALAPSDEVRAEGALWGCRREFYSNFRYPINSGSIADDVELMWAVKSRGLTGINVWSAIVLKVPPGTLRDFCLTNSRSRVAVADSPTKRSKRDFAVFATEAIKDPIGAVLYVTYRLYGILFGKRFSHGTRTETWVPSPSTKRN